MWQKGCSIDEETYDSVEFKWPPPPRTHEFPNEQIEAAKRKVTSEAKAAFKKQSADERKGKNVSRKRVRAGDENKEEGGAGGDKE